jgi:hypothetical protein
MVFLMRYSVLRPQTAVNTMKEKIVIIADMGHLRAFRFSSDPDEEPLRIHAREIEVEPLPDYPQPIHDLVSDQAGRFPRGENKGTMAGMERGEAHSLEQERERRLIQGLAERINRILVEAERPKWNLAAPRSICNRLRAALDPAVRDALTRVEMVDLTKESLEDIEERFAPGKPS